MTGKEQSSPQKTPEKKPALAQADGAAQPELETELYSEKMLPREKALPRNMTPRTVMRLQRTIDNRSFNQLHQPLRSSVVL